MTKKLLFNGCSYVAGDGLVWDDFRHDLEWEDILGKSPGKKNKLTQDQLSLI